MSRILIKDIKELITMDENRKRYKNIDLLIEDEEIKQIDKNIEIDLKETDEIIEAGDYFVFPGLINTHHHFYQTLTRNIPEAQGVELFNWLKFLYPIWAKLTPEAVYYSTLLASAELLKTGCTTSADHFYVFPENQEDNLIDHQFKAAEKIGIRFHGSRGSMSLSEEDGGLPPASVVQSEEEILKDSQRVIDKFHDDSKFAMQRVVLSPCSPFSVSMDLMKESIKLARQNNVLSHTHLAETLDENQYCVDSFGKRPLKLMEDLDWLGEDVWFAHGVHFNEFEIAKLAETKTGVSHCPASNMKLSSGVANIPFMLKNEMPVSLAVDGSASNDASNMILELKLAYLLHKAFHGIDSIVSEDILSIATNGGRDVLNQPEIGSIEKGKAADLIMVRSNRLGFAGGQSDPVEALVNTGTTQEVDYNIVNGKIVVREGKLTTINEDNIIEKHNQIAEKLLHN
ncbi:MAG: 8-oxoguanine deaminase [Halanaerobiales bacterium]|nr:8-oxoguanine deaminase [Halanaerobiales bacterium]